LTFITLLEIKLGITIVLFMKEIKYTI